MCKKTSTENFAWIVHPRDLKDVQLNIPLFRILPKILIPWIMILMPVFTQSKFKIGQNQTGYIIVVPLIPSHFKQFPWLSKIKVINSLRLANRYGIKNISVGGFITSIVKNNDLKNTYNQNIYDGTILLPLFASKKVKEWVSNNNISTKLLKIGIVGATTYVGIGLCKYLGRLYPQKIVMYSRTKSKLIDLQTELRSTGVQVDISDTLHDLDKCDIVLITTYLQEDISNKFKKGSLVYQVTEPIGDTILTLSNVRKDVSVLLGLQVRTPNIKYKNKKLGLKEKHSYTCLAEAVLLTEEDDFTNMTGYPDIDMKRAKDLLDKHNYSIS